jgi:hypothetical protein
MKNQLRKRTGIFACNDFAVISDHKESLGLASTGCSEVWTWVNKVAQVPAGVLGVKGATTNSWLNTQVFIQAWDTLMTSNQLWAHDWVVKVDPDAIFLPERLRPKLAPHKGPMFLLNCNWNGPKIFGALEVFSVPAIQTYFRQIGICKGLDWHGWGEDMYMQECMKTLQIPAIEDYAVVADDRCGNAPCTDSARAAFHAFKNIVAWNGCWTAATNTPTR